MYSVSVYDDYNGVMKNITILDLGENRMVVASTSNIDGAVFNPDPALDLPLPEGLIPIFYTKTMDAGKESIVAEYLGQYKQKKVVKKIIAGFEKAGWKYIESFYRDGDASTLILQFKRGGQDCMLGVTSLGEEGVNITVTLSGG